MTLAIAVLCWTLAVCVVLVTLALVGYIIATTKLAEAKTAAERRFGGGYP